MSASAVRSARGSRSAAGAVVGLLVAVAVASCAAGPSGMPSPTGPSASAASTPSAVAGGAPAPTGPSSASTSSPASPAGSGSEAGWSSLDREAVAAASVLLQARSRALQLADPAAWTATVADPGRPEGAAEVAAYAGLVALGVRELTAADVVPARSPMPSVPTVPTGPSASTVPTVPAAWQPDGPSGSTDAIWAGSMRLGYVIPGFDRAPRWVSRTIRLARTGSGWRIARWLGPTDRWEAFDLAPLAVVRSERALVAGPVALDVLRAHLDDVHTGQDRVAAVFGRAVPAVVIVPATADEAAHLLGSSAPPGGQIAATTHGARDPRAPALADRVVLDPTGLARLTPAGRRVVLTHELTHVSVRASTLHDLPLWLSEGFAEWVAFRDEGMDPRVVAAALLDRVRAAGPPARLPADADFAGTTGDPVAAYQGAWLAVAWIAGQTGAQGAVSLINLLAGDATGPALSAGPPSLDAALRHVLGRGEAELTAGWRADVLALARG